MSVTLRARYREGWRQFPATSIGIEPATGRVVGAGIDVVQVIGSGRWAPDDYFLPATRQRESAAERFARLAQAWKNDTRFVSSVSKMATSPAYQQIIGMGEQVLPLILAELKREPDHWFWALSAISGVDPISIEDAGNVDRMAEAWLRWGRAQGYLS